MTDMFDIARRAIAAQGKYDADELLARAQAADTGEPPPGVVEPPAPAEQEQQLDLMQNLPAAISAAEDGMGRADRAARVQEWKARAAAWIASQPPGATLTADDIVSAIGLPDHGVARNNVVGAFFSAAAKDGRLRFTGRFRKSERVIGHGNLQRVWEVT